MPVVEAGQPVALATVVEVQGASPAQVGFKLLVRPDGSGVGNVGGGALEQRVRDEAAAALCAASGAEPAWEGWEASQSEAAASIIKRFHSIPCERVPSLPSGFRQLTTAQNRVY